MKLLISTNQRVYDLMLAGHFNPLVWASANLETVAHYYEGCVVEIDVVLQKVGMEYVANMVELEQLGKTTDTYTYGMAKMRCLKGATWFSFSANYLRKNVKSIKEVFPDLSPWLEG